MQRYNPKKVVKKVVMGSLTKAGAPEQQCVTVTVRADCSSCGVTLEVDVPLLYVGCPGRWFAVTRVAALRVTAAAPMI